MQNHYVARPLKFHDKLPTQSYSFVYGVIPKDKLVTQEEVVGAVLLLNDKEVREVFGKVDELRIRKQVIQVLDLLVANRYVALVSGSVLERIAAAV